ncbi:hypothetical protein EVA_10899 [gut metagenome]|uniref:Uncharacterized protein n=1 Tax=gut metagenome TaxID=749906 RepID=J9CLL0_9ZZZZ
MTTARRFPIRPFCRRPVPVVTISSTSPRRHPMRCSWRAVPRSVTWSRGSRRPISFIPSARRWWP